MILKFSSNTILLLCLAAMSSVSSVVSLTVLYCEYQRTIQFWFTLVSFPWITLLLHRGLLVSESFSWIPRAQGLAVGYHLPLHLSLSGWVFFASFSTCLRQLEEIMDCKYSFWQQVDNTQLCISFSTDAISAATKLSGCLHKITLCLEKMSGVTSRKWWWWEVGKFQRDS